MKHYECNALLLRNKAEVLPNEPFEPFKRLDQLDVVFNFIDELNLPEDLADDAKSYTAKEWSGGGSVLPNGKLFILLNRNQTQERMNVTLLEEVAHYHYGHKPTTVGKNGLNNYDPVQEQEARFTAAAALLPSLVIAKSVFQRTLPKDIAKTFGASLELYEMRVKTLQFWEQYQKYALGQLA